MAEFGRHHEPLEAQRGMARLMLDRIARALMPERRREEAAE
jgi:hypothetical protein